MKKIRLNRVILRRLATVVAATISGRLEIVSAEADDVVRVKIVEVPVDGGEFGDEMSPLAFATSRAVRTVERGLRGERR